MGESFTSYLRDLFAELGPVSLRKMFGGQGLYHDGVIIRHEAVGTTGLGSSFVQAGRRKIS